MQGVLQLEEYILAMRHIIFRGCGGKELFGAKCNIIMRIGAHAWLAAPQVFRCSGLKPCPGGTPGSCTGGLIGTPCAKCQEGRARRAPAAVYCGQADPAVLNAVHPKGLFKQSPLVFA